MEFEESIKEDLLLMGVVADKVTHTSDYFDLLYEKALDLIKRGLAYADDTNVETMRYERGEGIESKCRNLSVEENLRRFEEMRQGTEFVSWLGLLYRQGFYLSTFLLTGPLVCLAGQNVGGQPEQGDA
jgi:glutamyl/glutaminyl-tRNA synthetase